MLSDDQKREFALRYLEYRRDAAKAAARLFPYDIASRMWALTELPGDPFVVQECERLLTERGHEAFLPTRFELAAMLYDTAEAAKAPDDKVKAARAYAEVMGFVDKGGINVDARTLVDNRSVVVVRDFGTDEDWERKAIAQQGRLIADARNDNQAAA